MPLVLANRTFKSKLEDLSVLYSASISATPTCRICMQYGLANFIRTSLREQRSTALKNPVLVAPAALASATLARFLLDPLLKTHGPYLFFAIAVVISALYAGKWAGIATLLLSIPICDYLFIEPRHTWFIHDAPADSIMLALFGVLGVLTTLIIDKLHENRKRLEQSLLALQRTESQLEMIDANVPEAIFTASEAGLAEHLNSFFGKYTGCDLHSLSGAGWLNWIHPDDRDSLLLELSSRRKEVEQFETIIRLRRSDGMYRAFKCHAMRKQFPDDNTATWFGVCSDIQNEKALAAALESRTQELVRLNESLERFAYTASHDLLEPLRTIGAMIELFLRRNRDALDSDSSAILVSVVKGADRMKRLIRDIMELARTAHSATDNATDVDMRAMAESAIANLGQAIHESGASIDVDDLPTIRANESAIVRLFQNLIANAIKYRSDRQPEVHISAALRNEEYVFSVRDNGIGIDPRYCDKIFEPFRRLHGNSQYEGSGLGLATCRRIVGALNGRIWVESIRGEGSIFYFTIPKDITEEVTTPTTANTFHATTQRR